VGMRRFLTLRWLGLHLVMIAIVSGFLVLGWWQLRRAEGGNALSWGYTFEWPLFAGFVVVFWLRTMRDEWRETQGAQQGPAASEVTLPAGVRAAGGPGAGTESDAGAGAGGDEEEDAELAAYNAYLARLNAEAARTGGRITQRGSRRQASWTGGGARARGASPRAADGPGDMEV
jgi:hypothetical protein